MKPRSEKAGTPSKGGRPVPRLPHRHPLNLPVIPLREVLVYPHMVVPLFIGREPSVKAMEAALQENRRLLTVLQRRPEEGYPAPADLYRVGTLTEVVQVMRLPDGTAKALVEGVERVEIQRFVQHTPYYRAIARQLSEREVEVSDAAAGLIGAIKTMLEQYFRLNRRGLVEVSGVIGEIQEPGRLADLLAAFLNLSMEERQTLLETLDPVTRLEQVGKLLSREVEQAEIETQITNRVRFQMDKQQREYFLREKLRQIRDELGETSEWTAELSEYRAKMAKAGLPEAVAAKADKELQRLEKMPSISAEASVIRVYLDWLVALPWSKRSRERFDLKRAEGILHRDHYGLEKVKERILEFLAVRHLSRKPSGTILCLIGPPGVGKTSLGRSIARALNREFVHMALGGVGDDAEIRGHRRTYVGAMPGRIIAALKQAGTKNPVMLLDEVDKLTHHWHGDPAAALLEVLDPDQNVHFTDHFLDVPFDLSEVFFILTGNVTHTISKTLLDRLEVVRLSGYTDEEKVQIARRYLLPKQKTKAGLQGRTFTLAEPVVRAIITQYTRESGVRELERQIGRLCQKAARDIVAGEPRPPLTPDDLADRLGPPQSHPPEAMVQDAVGLANGLAWAEDGGHVLLIEVTATPGKGEFKLTGHLGEVMKESAHAALSCVRARSEGLGIKGSAFRKHDVHIHVPEGAIPKDGPSAGIALAVALASLFSGRLVRHDVAMTGEITLRGRVLPIGGLKEKALAAYRQGIKTVLYPGSNRADLEEIPSEIRERVNFLPVQHIDEVLGAALA